MVFSFLLKRRSSKWVSPPTTRSRLSAQSWRCWMAKGSSSASGARHRERSNTLAVFNLYSTCNVTETKNDPYGSIICYSCYFFMFRVYNMKIHASVMQLPFERFFTFSVELIDIKLSNVVMIDLVCAVTEASIFWIYVEQF